MNYNEGLGEEYRSIQHVLYSNFSVRVDGKEAIQKMKANNLSWKQMEWQGWYFEEFGREALISNIGGGIGPRYGRTLFDYQRDFVWDLKLHSDNGSPKSGQVVLNDREAIENVIRSFGGVGFIIASAEVEYDHSGEFKIWHDSLKGRRSQYEQERIERGAPSRIRKTSFRVRSWKALFFDDFGQLMQGYSEGWAIPFQKGMRNADGSPRREKVMVNLNRVPERYTLH